MLESMRHPFIISYKGSFQDSKFTYFVTEYVQAGELFDLLKDRYVITEEETQFYAAQVALTLQYMHSKKVIYRDLKPENIMLTKSGYIKLIDFGLAQPLANDKTYTLCGTPQYMAPEILLRKGYGLAADWWALGILIYEMLTGKTPFDDDDPYEVFEKVMNNKVHFPRNLSTSAKTLLRGFLNKDPQRRLGMTSGGAERVKSMTFFDGVNFKDLIYKKTPSPTKDHKKSSSPSSDTSASSDEDRRTITHFWKRTASVPTKKDPFSDW